MRLNIYEHTAVENSESNSLFKNTVKFYCVEMHTSMGVCVLQVGSIEIQNKIFYLFISKRKYIHSYTVEYKWYSIGNSVQSSNSLPENSSNSCKITIYYDVWFTTQFECMLRKGYIVSGGEAGFKSVLNENC